jgi:hypothetical protein
MSEVVMLFLTEDQLRGLQRNDRGAAVPAAVLPDDGDEDEG